MASMQIIETAIDRSKSHNEIVTLDSLTMRRAGVSVAAVCRALHEECEGCSGDVVETGAGGVREYWGQDIDGAEWRVHVRVD